MSEVKIDRTSERYCKFKDGTEEDEDEWHEGMVIRLNMDGSYTIKSQSDYIKNKYISERVNSVSLENVRFQNGNPFRSKLEQLSKNPATSSSSPVESSNSNSHPESSKKQLPTMSKKLSNGKWVGVNHSGEPVTREFKTHSDLQDEFEAQASLGETVEGNRYYDLSISPSMRLTNKGV